MSATGFASALDLVWTPGDQRHSARLHWQSQWHTITAPPTFDLPVRTRPDHLPPTPEEIARTLAAMEQVEPFIVVHWRQQLF